MNIKVNNDVGTIFTALLSGLLIIVAAMVAVEPQEVSSQNVTDIFTLPSERGTQNQNTTAGGSISPTGQTGAQNQTQMALDNLTRADFSNVTSALDSARDSILANSSRDAYTSLSDANDALFITALGKGPSAMTTIIKITDPMRNNIGNAQDALLHDDLPNAMKERNSAEVELVRITQGLPAGEEGLSAGEEEPPSDEEEPSEDEEE